MGALVAKSVAEVRQATRAARTRGLSVGLVPTMGALHVGHASLIRAARLECGFVVVSIFVNPTQFGPNEDFTRYPRTLEQDLEMCALERADLAFTPANEEVYPPDFHTFVEVEALTAGLCGRARPGHFRGVATVVLKLFNMVQPDFAYFGQKDAQQARVIEQMVRDLDVPLQVRICPIVRAEDGLALSSRNRYLSPAERAQATVLSRALWEAQQLIDHGERRAAVVEESLRRTLATAPLGRIDYIAVVSYATLQPCATLAGKVFLALAVFFGTTRLIDNVLVDVPNT